MFFMHVKKNGDRSVASDLITGILVSQTTLCYIMRYEQPPPPPFFIANGLPQMLITDI